MISSLRAASQKWYGRLIMAVVLIVMIVGFVGFGAREFFYGATSQDVVIVGSRGVSQQQFQRIYQNQLNALQQQAHRPITPAEARQKGLDRYVLSILTTQEAFSQFADKLGLRMSNADLRRAIVEDESFKNASGAFDADAFEKFLSANNMREADYTSERRRQLLNDQVIIALAGGVKTPRVYMEAVDRYRSETRSLAYVQLDPAQIAASPDPDPVALQAFYELRKAQYATPAFKKLSVLRLAPLTLANPDEVEQKFVEKYYDEVKTGRIKDQEMGAPEMRHIQQIAYANAEEAKAAREKIQNGGTFEQAGADRGVSPKDMDLGTGPAGQFVKPIADAAFALGKDQVSEPIDTGFGYALVRAINIVPATLKPFSEVQDVARRRIAEERGALLMEPKRAKIEELRTDGKNLSEVAQSEGLKVETFEAVDQNGADRAGAPVSFLAKEPALLQAVAASDVGVYNDPVSASGKSVIWFEVVSKDPSRPLTLEEAKDRVLADWRKEQMRANLESRAQDLVKKLRDGAKLEELAQTENLTVQRAEGVKRAGGGGLQPEIVRAAFAQPIGGAGAVASGAGRFVFQVLSSKVPPYDPANPDSQQLAEYLNRGLQDEIFEQSAQMLQSEYGVRYNPAFLKALNGGSDE